MKKVGFGIAAIMIAAGSAFAAKMLAPEAAYVQIVSASKGTLCRDVSAVCDGLSTTIACAVTVQLDTTPPTTPNARAKRNVCQVRLFNSLATPITFYNAPETDIISVIN